MKELFLLFTLLFSVCAFAQNDNPFASIGKNEQVQTLSNGRYEEVFRNDTLRRVGSVMMNIVTEKIDHLLSDVELQELKKLEKEREASRFLSIDPLARQYPFYTPYQYAGNKPIACIDIDGMEEMPNEIFNALKTYGKNMIKKATSYAVAKVYEITGDYAAEKSAEKIKEHTTASQQQELSTTLEFISGKGPEERNFGENEPITQSLKSSNLTTEALKAFYKGYSDYKSGKRPNIPPQFRVDFSYLYPLDGNTGPIKEYAKDGWTSAQFTGTAMFYFKLDEANGMLGVQVYDTKNENSFLYHLPGTDKHSRDENSIMGETTQTYDFTISMEEVTKRATGDSSGQK